MSPATRGTSIPKLNGSIKSYIESDDSDSSDDDSLDGDSNSRSDEEEKRISNLPKKLTLSNEETIQKAFELFKLGLLVPPLYVSSLYPFKDTPPEILAHDIELMEHPKRFIRPNHQNPDPLDDESTCSEDDTSI